MLHVGRSRGELRSGFRGMEAEEEEEEEEVEHELEEGEARFGRHRGRHGGAGHDDNDDDDNDDNEEFIDPDALTYIDEKLQDVLGHFQKDFEAGVSAENLGSKFGGYGSFLPTYQRSPGLPQPRSPLMPSNHNSASRSPYIPPVQNARQNPPPVTNSSIFRSYTSAIDNPGKNGNRGSTLSEKDVNPPQQLLNRVVSGSEQKTLKVRIKVGNDSILARNNAAIYSGLGLDISPSSSINDSPDGSGGVSPESRVMPDESPRTILQIMTCLSIPGGFLLSPLQGNFLEVREKVTPSLKKYKGPVVQKKSAEPHGDSNNITPYARDIEGHITMKMKSDEKKGRLPSDLKISNCIDSSSTVVNKDTGTVAGNSGNDDKCLRGKSKASKVERTLEEHSMNSNKEPLLDLQREYKMKDDTCFDKVKSDSDGYKDQSSASQQNPSCKATSHERDRERVMLVEEQLFGNRQKELGNPINTVASMDIKTDDLGVQTSGTSKGKKKNSSSRANQSEKKVKVKPQKERTSDIIRKSHGDDVSDALENRSGFSTLPHKDKRKAAKLEKNLVTSREMSKDRPGGRNDDTHLSDTFAVESLSMPPACNTVTAESAAAAPAPATVLIKEEWVGCDKCEKWRLLPYGTNPDCLPKKWQCSMIYWLPPGMNSCKVSEDESTKALRALYMVPAPELNISSDGRHDGTAPGIMTAVTTPTLGHNMQSMTSAEKRKNGPKDGGKIPNHLHLTEASKSLKRQQVPTMSRNVDDVDCSPAAQDPFDKDFEEPGYKSWDLTVEKQLSKHKEKRKNLGSYSDRGESVAKSNKHSKFKSKAVADHDDFRASKKIKKAKFNEPVKHRQSEFEVGENGSLNKAMLKNSHKYNGVSSGKEKCDSKVNVSLSSKRLHEEEPILSNGNISKNSSISDAERSDQLGFSIKKRKVTQWQLSQCDLEAKNSNQNVLTNSIAKEASSESESAKDEKPMAARSELKASKTGDDRFVISQVTRQEDLHSMKKEISYAQPSTAATSSSSKVSSSHRRKADFQETKGSPVESVSSSPLRSGDRNILDPHRRYAHGVSENMYSQDVVNVNTGHRKSGKSASSRSKEKHNVKSDIDKVKVNVSGGFNGDMNLCSLNNGDMQKDEQDLLAKSDLKEKCSGLDKRDDQSNSGMEQNVDARDPSTHPNQQRTCDSRTPMLEVNCISSNANNDLKMPSSHQDERSAIRFRSDQNEHTQLAFGKEALLQKSDKEKADNHGLKIAPLPAKGSKLQLSANGTTNFDASKLTKQTKRTVPNGVQNNTFKQATVNGDTTSTINTSVVLKEARDLKHMANRLRDEGQELESTSLYFEAALKFLHVASLMEPPSFDSSKQGEAGQSMQMYTETAKLCGYCAHEFERLKKMAPSALAYKCVEVAYMKAAFYKYPGAVKDRHELQTALHMVPPGESPSSSASDVDNLNNQSTLAKAASAKGIHSPHIASNHVLAARSYTHFLRLLTYTNDLNNAFEATRKSQNAVSAFIASTAKDQADGIASVRKVLDFNFQNIKGLLQLIRLSMESISR